MTLQISRLENYESLKDVTWKEDELDFTDQIYCDDMSGGYYNNKRYMSTWGHLWTEALPAVRTTPLATFSTSYFLPFIFPWLKMGDTISIPLKYPIIAPTLGLPSPSSAPNHTGTKTSLFLARQPIQAQPPCGMRPWPAGWILQPIRVLCLIVWRKCANPSEKTSLWLACPCISSADSPIIPRISSFPHQIQVVF